MGLIHSYKAIILGETPVERSIVLATDGVGAGEFRRQRVRYECEANIFPPDHREETVSGDDGEFLAGGG
jgi:hypothetical protein